MASKHSHLQTSRAFVTNVSSSSEDLDNESTAMRKVTRILNHEPIDQKEQLRNLHEQIAMNHYEFGQQANFLAGGEDVTPSPSITTAAISYAKYQKEFKSKGAKQSHPPLTNLQFHFEDAEALNQYFNYKTALGTIRVYISEVLKRYNGTPDFYMSTKYPNRILVPELDKMTLEELGLYPTAMIDVHVIAQDQRNGVAALTRRKSLIQRLGGFTTIMGVTLWTVFHPVMVATNWLGFRHYLSADEDEEYEGFPWNIVWNIFNLNQILDN